MTASSIRLVGVSGGVGTPSTTSVLTETILTRVRDQLADSGPVPIVETISVPDIARDAVDEVVGGLRTTSLDRALATIEAADVLVVASPVFRGSYSGILKTVMDLLEPGSLRGVPAVLAATTGSTRHTLMTEHALRPLLSYFGALTMPTSVVATPEDFVLGSEPVPDLARRIDRVAGEVGSVLAGRDS